MDTSAVPQGVNVNAMFTSCAFPLVAKKISQCEFRRLKAAFQELLNSTNQQTHISHMKNLCEANDVMTLLGFHWCLFTLSTSSLLISDL